MCPNGLSYFADEECTFRGNVIYLNIRHWIGFQCGSESDENVDTLDLSGEDETEDMSIFIDEVPDAAEKYMLNYTPEVPSKYDKESINS